MIINLIDSRSGTLRSDAWEASAPVQHVARIVAGKEEPLNNVVRRVIQQSEGNRSIWLLRIMAHGNSGFLQLGGDFLTQFNCHEFAALAGLFTPGGIGVALHSCGPASDTSICRDPEGVIERLTTGKKECITVPGRLAAGGGRGVAFLLELARMTRVPVRGGLNLQVPDPRFSYEGPSVVVACDGRIVAVPDWGRLALDTTRIIASRRQAA